MTVETDVVEKFLKQVAGITGGTHRSTIADDYLTGRLNPLRSPSSRRYQIRYLSRVLTNSPSHYISAFLNPCLSPEFKKCPPTPQKKLVVQGGDELGFAVVRHLKFLPHGCPPKY